MTSKEKLYTCSIICFNFLRRFDTIWPDFDTLFLAAYKMLVSKIAAKLQKIFELYKFF